MTDLGQIQDIKTETVEGFNEYTKIRGSVEIVYCKDRVALWQAICGEIKTPIGECRGVGMETYGCDVWRILGQNLTPVVIDTAQYYISDIVKKYDEVEGITIKNIVKQHDGKLTLEVYVDSIFGPIEGDIIVE